MRYIKLYVTLLCSFSFQWTMIKQDTSKNTKHKTYKKKLKRHSITISTWKKPSNESLVLHIDLVRNIVDQWIYMSSVAKCSDFSTIFPMNRFSHKNSYFVKYFNIFPILVISWVCFYLPYHILIFTHKNINFVLSKKKTLLHFPLIFFCF